MSDTKLFIQKIKDESKDVVMLHLTQVTGKTLSNIMELKSKKQLNGKNINSLYKEKKIYKLPCLKSVDHFMKKIPFCDYSKLKDFTTDVKCLKYIDLSIIISNVKDITIQGTSGKNTKRAFEEIMRRFPGKMQIIGTNLYSK
jgi:hypothetical protein